MFEYFFSSVALRGGVVKKLITSLNGVETLAPLIWGEHCMECSAPYCYKTCSRYKSRADGHCERFQGGLIPVEIEGRICAKVRFKSWSKLETTVTSSFWRRNDYLNGYVLYLRLGYAAKFLSALVPGKRLKSKLFGLSDRLFKILKRKTPLVLSDAGVLTLDIINQDHPTKFHLDLKLSDASVSSRVPLTVPLGKSHFVVEVEIDKIKYIALHPSDSEEEVEIIIDNDCLQPLSRTAPKVKCVIWDLDNTLWDGVLVEDKKVRLREDLIQLIRSLDQRGIVNSIASKNDEEFAVSRLRELGIDDLFVFCKINWEPKSINIQNTIKSMNINANSVIFVDDSPFEREEVGSAIPDIVCIDPADVKTLCESERFQVNASHESSGRRQTYRMLEKLIKDKENWAGNIDSFLLSCDIRVEIRRPEDSELKRCCELLQRTNQLNASGNRLTEEEVERRMKSDDYDCVLLQSSDKYGSYGIVGFLCVKKKELATITDFVISCRVANKKIEGSVINYLSNQYGGGLLFAFKQTKLNAPMKKVIDELAMQLYAKNAGESQLYRHDYIQDYPHIVNITDKLFV